MRKTKKSILINKWHELDKQEVDLFNRLKGLGERSQRKTELAYKLRELVQQKMRIEAELTKLKIDIEEVLK